MTLLEADSITGTARAFIEFCRAAGPLAPVLAIDPFVVSFRRPTAVRRDPELQAALYREFQMLGVCHERILERFRFDAGVISRFRSMVRHVNPDILESHSLKSHAVIWLSGLWRSIPWLAYHHGYTATDRKVRIYNHADHFTLHAADRVVTVAEAFIPILIRRGVDPTKVRVVRSAIETPQAAGPDEKGTMRQSLGIPKTARVVLSVGRLSQEKDVEVLLRAFARLAGPSDPNTMLLIVGDGPERQRLERIAAGLGVSNRTRFAGQVPDPSRYYAAADVFALPSRSEGSPYALLEAMAASLPIAATAVGGVPEIVSHGVNGLLVPSGNSQAMAAAIERLLTDSVLARRIAHKGHDHIADACVPRNRAVQILRLFKEVLNERNAGIGA